MTHHITAVGDRNIICRAGASNTEVRSIDSGVRWKTLDIPGLNCSLEVGGVVYCGSQFKRVYAVSTTTFDIISSQDVQGSVNSFSLGANKNMLVCGQTSGVVAIFDIGRDKKSGQHILRKKSEYKVCEKNISKVVRTTRNDFALGTSAGMVFCKLAKDH